MGASIKTPQAYQPDPVAGFRAVVLQSTVASYTSTSSTVMVPGSDFDAVMWSTIAITAKVTTNAVTWSVFGANLADYSDAIQLQVPASISANGVGSYSASFFPYAYCFVKATDTVGGTHGSISLNVMAKTA